MAASLLLNLLHAQKQHKDFTIYLYFTRSKLGENIIVLTLDVFSKEIWVEVVGKTEAAFGPIDVLVNNAGIGIFKTLEELTVKDFELTFKVDELGVFLGMQKYFLL